jgi:hypothetical protein
MINHHPLTSGMFGHGIFRIEELLFVIVLLGLLIGVRFGHRFTSLKKWWQRYLLGMGISAGFVALLYGGCYVYEFFTF